MGWGGLGEPGGGAGDGAGDLGGEPSDRGVCAAGSRAGSLGGPGWRGAKRFPRHIHNVTKANSVMLVNHASRSPLGN